jgi:exonuclease VII small subunit
MKTFIVSVVTSLILMTIIFVVGPRSTISKLATRTDSLEQAVTQLEDSHTKLTASLTDSFNNQTAYVKTVEEQLTASLTDLNNTISTLKSSVQNEAAQRSSDTATLTNKINAANASLSDLSTLKNDINTINNSLSALSTKVSTLQAIVKDLEAASNLVAEISSTSGLEIADGDSSFTGTMVVKVTNDTSEDMTGIKLSLSFDADETIPDVTTATLTGGSVTWTYSEQDGNTLYFKNKTGFTVAEGSYKKMTLTLKVYFDEDVTADTTFEPSVEITDYS